jgi:hypothetical protein
MEGLPLDCWSSWNQVVLGVERKTYGKKEMLSCNKYYRERSVSVCLCNNSRRKKGLASHVPDSWSKLELM